jgi:hypothetical protein
LIRSVPAAAGWVCHFAAQPEIQWFSSTDQTTDLLGLSCTPLAEPPPGMGPSAWYRFWKILDALEHAIPLP